MNDLCVCGETIVVVVFKSKSFELSLIYIVTYFVFMNGLITIWFKISILSITGSSVHYLLGSRSR